MHRVRVTFLWRSGAKPKSLSCHLSFQLRHAQVAPCKLSQRLLFRNLSWSSLLLSLIPTLLPISFALLVYLLKLVSFTIAKAQNSIYCEPCKSFDSRPNSFTIFYFAPNYYWSSFLFLTLSLYFTLFPSRLARWQQVNWKLILNGIVEVYPHHSPVCPEC